MSRMLPREALPGIQALSGGFRGGRLGELEQKLAVDRCGRLGIPEDPQTEADLEQSVRNLVALRVELDDGAKGGESAGGITAPQGALGEPELRIVGQVRVCMRCQKTDEAILRLCETLLLQKVETAIVECLDPGFGFARVRPSGGGLLELELGLLDLRTVPAHGRGGGGLERFRRGRGRGAGMGPGAVELALQ